MYRYKETCAFCRKKNRADSSNQNVDSSVAKVHILGILGASGNSMARMSMVNVYKYIHVYIHMYHYYYVRYGKAKSHQICRSCNYQKARQTLMLV